MAVYLPSATVNYADTNATVQGGTTVTGTSANATLVTLTLPNNTALYKLRIVVFVSGTVTATEANNMILTQGSTTLMTLPVIQSASAGPVVVEPIVNAAVSQTIAIKVGAATPGASAGYNVSVVAIQVS